MKTGIEMSDSLCMGGTVNGFTDMLKKDAAGRSACVCYC